MKNIAIIVLILLSTLSTKVYGQYVTIPDSNFMYFLQNNYPTCMQGNQMDTTCNDILSETLLMFGNFYSINDLTGVEYFENVTYLDLYMSDIGHLSALPPNLEYLMAYDNNITSIAYLPSSITSLALDNNQLTSLPPLPPTLRYFDISANLFNTLPPLPNTLQRLWCNRNDLLTTLPTLPNSLYTLEASWCNLSSLPVLPNSLIVLECQENALTSLPALPNSLQELRCEYNLLTSLPELPPYMSALNIDGNPITCLPQLKKIDYFIIGNTNITCLPNYGQVTYSSPPLSTYPLCNPYNNNGCPVFYNITGKAYLDENSNCIFDLNETVYDSVTVYLFENNQLIDQTVTAYGGNYLFNVQDSIGTYKVTIDSTNLPSSLSCANSGFYTAVITTTDTLFTGQDFAFSCVTSSSTINTTACNRYVSPSGNYTLTSSGTYLDTVINANTCDSIFTINLTINNSTSITISPTTCDSYTSPSGNYTWTTSGTYTDIMPNANGCDSIITVNLTINNSSNSIINPVVCLSYTSPSGNNTWTISGSYMDTLPNANGCDSIITVNLTINNSTNSVINPVVCYSYTSLSGNYTWTTSGTYTDTITSSLGCYSIITVNLTINNSSSSVINPVVCYSYTSPSGNYTWTTSSTYMDTIPNANGCDSIITVNLTINNSSSSVINPTVCFSYTSPSGNYTWTTSGTYMDTIPSSLGCDSIITINLTLSSLNSIVNLVNNRYLTCGLSCIRLNANTPSGPGSYNYSWSTGKTTKNIRVCPTATTTYTLTVTDASGCTLSDSATVIVSDTLCGTGRVTICRTLRNRELSYCIDTAQLAAYLSQGATLGCCTNGHHLTQGPSGLGGLFSQVYPNPFTLKTTIEFGSEQSEFITVEIFNSIGQRIAKPFNGSIEAFNIYKVDFFRGTLPTGIYISKITSAKGEVNYHKLFISN